MKRFLAKSDARLYSGAIFREKMRKTTLTTKCASDAGENEKVGQI